MTDKLELANKQFFRMLECLRTMLTKNCLELAKETSQPSYTIFAANNKTSQNYAALSHDNIKAMISTLAIIWSKPLPKNYREICESWCHIIKEEVEIDFLNAELKKQARPLQKLKRKYDYLIKHIEHESASIESLNHRISRSKPFFSALFSKPKDSRENQNILNSFSDEDRHDVLHTQKLSDSLHRKYHTLTHARDESTRLKKELDNRQSLVDSFQQQLLVAADRLASRHALLNCHYLSLDYLVSQKIQETASPISSHSNTEKAINCLTQQLESTKQLALRQLRPTASIYTRMASEHRTLSSLYAIKAALSPEDAEKNKALSQLIYHRTQAAEANKATKLESKFASNNTIGRSLSRFFTRFHFFWKTETKPIDQFEKALNPKTWINPSRLILTLVDLYKAPNSLMEHAFFVTQKPDALLAYQTRLREIFAAIYDRTGSTRELVAYYNQMGGSMLHNLIGALQNKTQDAESLHVDAEKLRMIELLITTASKTLYDFIKLKPDAHKNTLIKQHDFLLAKENVMKNGIFSRNKQALTLMTNLNSFPELELLTVLYGQPAPFPSHSRPAVP